MPVTRGAAVIPPLGPRVMHSVPEPGPWAEQLGPWVMGVDSLCLVDTRGMRHARQGRRETREAGETRDMQGNWGDARHARQGRRETREAGETRGRGDARHAIKIQDNLEKVEMF